MIVVSCIKYAVLVVAAGLGNAKPFLRPPAPLPTPHQLQLEVDSRLLKGCRDLLESTRELRQSYEKRTDGDHGQRIGELKGQEAELARRIELLEQRRNASPPTIPVLPRQKPKPQVRD